jgi:hypothetical protein
MTGYIFENDIRDFIKKDDIGWVCLIDHCGPFCDIKTMIQHFEILGLDPGEHDKRYKKFERDCEVLGRRLATTQEVFDSEDQPE